MRRLLVTTAVLVACCLLLAAAPGPKIAAPAAAGAVKPIAGEISVTSKSPQAIEAMKAGRSLIEDARTDEAIAQFKKALELDPDFALANAYLGSITPGAEGLKQIERAASLAKGLPPAERMLIDTMLAGARGEEEKALGLWRKLATMAPGDWRVHLGLGTLLSAERKWDEAVAALRKASELNPSSGTAVNIMGYAYLNMNKNDQAIEAFRKYAAIRPGEPNPQDSLAEALMAAGRFEEAEAAFRKAVEISPQFWISWEGVAQTRFLRGDWEGGREALGKARAAATRAVDKLDPDMALAWSYAAEGNKTEAIRTFDEAEKTAVAEKVDMYQAIVPLNRALLMVYSDRPEDALKEVASGLDRAGKLGLPGGALIGMRLGAYGIRIMAESRLGQTADVSKTLALVEAEAKKVPGNPQYQSSVHYARGEAALARRDVAAAVQHFTKCLDLDFACRLQLAAAQEKSGNKAGAEETWKQILAANRRDPLYVYLRAQAGVKPAPAAKAGPSS